MRQCERKEPSKGRVMVVIIRILHLLICHLLTPLIVRHRERKVHSKIVKLYFF
jgi:hypothetical protein